MQIINRKSGKTKSATKVAEGRFLTKSPDTRKKGKSGLRDAWSCKLRFNVILAVQTVPLTQELVIQI